MNFYFIFANKDKLDDIVLKTVYPMYSIIINNKVHVLYAVTDKKKYLNEFINSRKDIFKVKKKNIDKDDMNEEDVRLINIFKLDYLPYSNGKKYIDILSTNHEFYVCISTWAEYLFDNESISYITKDKINLLKSKYIKSLSKIGLQSSIIIYKNKVESKETDFGTDFHLDTKSLNIFIHIFKSTLK